MKIKNKLLFSISMTLVLGALVLLIFTFGVTKPNKMTNRKFVFDLKADGLKIAKEDNYCKE